jgi:hypothetical protein
LTAQATPVIDDRHARTLTPCASSISRAMASYRACIDTLPRPTLGVSAGSAVVPGALRPFCERAFAETTFFTDAREGLLDGFVRAEPGSGRGSGLTADFTKSQSVRTIPADRP